MFYETCNTCFENGNGIEHKCKTCKFGYEKYDNNCIKCDMNRKYWYYDSNLINFYFFLQNFYYFIFNKINKLPIYINKLIK